MRKFIASFLLAITMLVVAAPAMAATGPSITTGGQTCWVSGKVVMRFFNAANSTPITGYYITGGGHSSDPSATYPNNTWNNTFVPLNVPANTSFAIVTNMKRWFASYYTMGGVLITSKIKFTSGSPAIPAPVVFKASPFFVCQ